MTPFTLFESADAKRKRHLENQLALLLELTNRFRASQGEAAIKVHPQLMQSAQAKADDMAAKSYFNHDTPDGKGADYFIGSAGYPVHLGYSQNMIEGLPNNTAEEWIKSWAGSPEHRDNMLAPWEHFGVGVSIQERFGLFRVRTVAHFGTLIG